MARQRIKYKLVGRYVRGNDTVYYGLISEDGKELRATEEVMAYYVGREQVINVTAKLYKNKVLFRGIGCDIKSLPTIQLQTEDRRINTSDTTGGDKSAQVTNSLHMIYRILTNIPERYQRIPEYSKLEISMTNTIHIKQQIKTKDTIKNKQYIIESINGTIYFRQTEYMDKYIFKINKISGTYMDLMLGVLGYIETKKIDELCNSSSLLLDDIRAFNAYTGASNYFNDIARGLGTKYVDMTSIGNSIIQTIRMLTVYDKLRKENRKIELHIFHGGYKPSKGYVDKGFLSYSYSLDMASQFAGKDKDILITSYINYEFAVKTEDIAVCLENGDVDEREITLKPNLKCTNISQIGYYDGHKIYMVEYCNTASYKEDINYLISWISTLKDNMQAYLLKEILHRDTDILIKGNEYEQFKIYNNIGCNIKLQAGWDDEFYTVLLNDNVLECNNIDKCKYVAEHLFNTSKNNI